jgi:hypothetical protein
LPVLFAVNSLAPYILACLMHKPKHLICLSSGMHLQGNPNLDNLPLTTPNRSSSITYPDTKLHNLFLPMSVAKEWNNVYDNAVNPGWVSTKMDGAGAPDSLDEGYQIQIWLAANNDSKVRVSGSYFHIMQQGRFLPAAKETPVQKKFLARHGELTNVRF